MVGQRVREASGERERSAWRPARPGFAAESLAVSRPAADRLTADPSARSGASDAAARRERPPPTQPVAPAMHVVDRGSAAESRHPFPTPGGATPGGLRVRSARRPRRAPPSPRSGASCRRWRGAAPRCGRSGTAAPRSPRCSALRRRARGPVAHGRSGPTPGRARGSALPRKRSSSARKAGQAGSSASRMWLRPSSGTNRASGMRVARSRPSANGTTASSLACSTIVGTDTCAASAVTSRTARACADPGRRLGRGGEALELVVPRHLLRRRIRQVDRREQRRNVAGLSPADSIAPTSTSAPRAGLRRGARGHGRSRRREGDG